jgi:hypothetical protein
MGPPPASSTGQRYVNIHLLHIPQISFAPNYFAGPGDAVSAWQPFVKLGPPVFQIYCVSVRILKIACSSASVVSVSRRSIERASLAQIIFASDARASEMPWYDARWYTLPNDSR